MAAAQSENVGSSDGVNGETDRHINSTLPAEHAEKTISKNQQKKLRKQEMKLKFRLEKRKLERERKKEKRKQAIADGEVLPPSRKQLRKTVKDPININVVVDNSFEEHMAENDIKKLVKQIQHCYAINRRTDVPFKYYISSYGGRVKNIIEKLAGTHSWNVTWSDKSYDEIFAKESIVYLSAESENVLTELEEGKAYVIGGLVDHNSKKGLCHKLAVEKGIHHAQLPISEYIDLKCRKVLTIDHVFEILQKYQEQKDWESAFFSVIPKRKGAQCKADTDTTNIDESAKESDNEHQISDDDECDSDSDKPVKRVSDTQEHTVSYDDTSTL